jgi:hypothetical protein
MENISKEKLEEGLGNIEKKITEQREILQKCAQSERELVNVKNTSLLELAKLQGEERALKGLLSTFAPIEGGKK